MNAVNRSHYIAGMEQLLYDFSREVLREQPANIHSFAAQYFANKIAERAGANFSHANHHYPPFIHARPRHEAD